MSKKVIPKELRGIWNVQYAPRERLLERHLGHANLKKYNAMSYSSKIQLIDLLESDGYFERIKNK